MSTPYLLLLAAMAALCLYFARRKKDDGVELKETTTSPLDRTIIVYDMEEEKIREVVDDFIDLYSDRDSGHGDMERPAIDTAGDAIRLTFGSTMTYIEMCYWVNYLVYADEGRRHRYEVRGWYPFGEVQINGEKQPFSDQIVMIYVDKGDKEADNICFVTPDGSHYIHLFAVGGSLRAYSESKEEYQRVIF